MRRRLRNRYRCAFPCHHVRSRFNGGRRGQVGWCRAVVRCSAVRSGPGICKRCGGLHREQSPIDGADVRSIRIDAARNCGLQLWRRIRIGWCCHACVRYGERAGGSCVGRYSTHVYSNNVRECATRGPERNSECIATKRTDREHGPLWNGTDLFMQHRLRVLIERHRRYVRVHCHWHVVGGSNSSVSNRNVPSALGAHRRCVHVIRFE